MYVHIYLSPQRLIYITFVICFFFTYILFAKCENFLSPSLYVCMCMRAC
jgi:hypothetical protein